MDRRTFLTSSAALGVTASPSAASTNDPLVDMFARWEVVKRQWFSLIPDYPNFDDPEMLALEAVENSLLKEMLSRKAQTVEGLRCQITLLWEEFGPDFIDGSEGSKAERKDPAFILMVQIMAGVECLTASPSWQNINPKMLSPSQF